MPLDRMDVDVVDMLVAMGVARHLTTVPHNY
jgi:hypothetical protein